MRKPSAPFRSLLPPALTASVSILLLQASGWAQANQPPVAGADTILTRSTGQPVAIPNLLANDHDPEGGSLRITSVIAGEGGLVSQDEQNQNLVIFRPGRTFDGTGTFSYRVTDSVGVSATGSVTVRNPFMEGKGTYAGPLSGNPAIPNSAGYMQLSLSTGGIATIQLAYGREQFRFKGLFELDGTLQSELKLPNGDVRMVSLQFPLEGVDQPITGTFSGGDETVMITLPRMLYRRSSPPPYSGVFTVTLPADQPEAGSPKGVSYGILKVSTAGNASFVGKLGDGDRFSMRMYVKPDGTVPVFAQLYGNRGSLAGTLNFADVNGMTHVQGNVSWFKPKIRRDSSYPMGFDLALISQGSRYTAPAVDTVPLNFPFTSGAPNATFYFRGAGFTPEVAGSVFVPPRPARGSYTMTPISLKRLGFQCKIDARTGIFTGSLLKPNRSGRRKFSGVLVQSMDLGYGVIDGGKTTGELGVLPHDLGGEPSIAGSDF